jgi:hypothetical protein
LKASLPQNVGIDNSSKHASSSYLQVPSSKMSSTPLYAYRADGEVFPCQNPHNVPLCQALLDKSETYPLTGKGSHPKNTYKYKNYVDAAETVAILTYSIPHINFEDSVAVVDKLRNYFGPSTTEFIIDFCKKNTPAPPSRPSIYQQLRTRKVKCAHPDNEPVYKAVMDRAAAYPPEKKYQREAYLNAAASLAALKVSLRENFYNAFAVDSGPKTQNFILDIARKLEA